ncbi:MAG: hypothetical protein ORN49_09000, partial [Rhodobacteraceae bacterium]|nr:hypothetical protein [Paracoccaceae bacterium]
MRHRGAIIALVACAPGAALAHASQHAVILTLPTQGFVWGAGLAVGLTALVTRLGTRLPAFTPHQLFARPTLLPDGLTGWLSAVLLLALIFAGLFGSRDPYENPLPLMVWTVIWAGLTLMQALFGDLWCSLSPWVAPGRSLRTLLGRTDGIGLARFGHWPAVLGLCGFAWLEIIALAPEDPAHLAMILTAYAGIIFLLAVLEGEGWLAQGEFLTVFFTFIARIAPLWSVTEGQRVSHFAGLPGARLLAQPPLSPSEIGFV